MSNTFVFSKNLPYNSIVNPDVDSKDYLDLQSPFSFFDFLKYTKAELAPAQFNDLYIYYIREWNRVKDRSVYQINQTIKDRYVELIKQITLKYTTSEEKRFLSNIDMNDPSDLDIIIPFYSKKIIEVCNFYSEKRENLKFKVQKNKIKGTGVSLEKAIFESITDTVFSDFLEIADYQELINQDDLLVNLNIEIEELYDLYTNYLDNDPDESYETYDVKTEIRQTLYSSNINKIDADLFINIEGAIKKQIFEDIRVFLVEFGRIFTINYNVTDVNLNCKPDEKLFNLVNTSKPNATRLVELRNLLIKKYIGSDFYYITTGSTITDVTSGILFKADNPTGNLLNRHFPTTASIEEESDLQSCRRIGLFFTPEKNSILYFSVPEKKYKIDESKLEPDKLYVFPDPNLYGNTFGLKRTYNKEYPLIQVCDYTKSVKNFSTFSIDGDINSNPYKQSFFPYVSRNQLSNSNFLGKQGLNTNLSSLYNKGILTQWQTDIFGNQFGLFKKKNRLNIRENVPKEENVETICEYYDGGPITFFENGILPENVLASNSSWVYPNIWSSYYYYNVLLEHGIGGIRNGLMERGLYWNGYLIDGLIIDRTKFTTEQFDISLNPLNSIQLNLIDGKNYDYTGLFDTVLNTINFSLTSNYDYIINGLKYDRSPTNVLFPLNNTLDGNPLGNQSEFKPEYEYDYILSSIKYKEFDAGTFDEICETEFDFEILTNQIIKQTLIKSRTISADYDDNEEINIYNLKNSFGNIYIKDVLTGNVTHLSSGLSDLFDNRYLSLNNEIYDKVIDFNIYNDFVWFRTQNNIIFEKLSYEDGKFSYSGTKENYIKYNNTNEISQISNPFIFENRDYAMIVKLSGFNINSNSFSIIPTFYKINYKDCTIQEIINNEPLSSYMNNSLYNDVKLRKIIKPSLFYNSRNNKYGIVSIVEDINEFMYLYVIKFDFNGISILNQKIYLYNFNKRCFTKTYNFYDNPTIGEFQYNPISNPTISINQEMGELILS